MCLSDLRESGSIEQDADIVMFLYRDDYYNEESENKNIAEVIIAKNRSGSVFLAHGFHFFYFLNPVLIVNNLLRLIQCFFLVLVS